jgi:hypothetical protein
MRFGARGFDMVLAKLTAKRVLTAVRGFFRKAALPALAAISVAGSPGTAWSLSSTQISENHVLGLCTVEIASSPASETAYVRIESYYAGGDRFAYGEIEGDAYIGAASIADCLGTSEGNITELQQFGANGTYVTDDYIGFSFRLTEAIEGYAAGRYEYAVTNASTSTVVEGATFTNTAPVASAGPDQTNVQSGVMVTLNGSGSSDADAGTTLTYVWTQTAGTVVTLSSTTTANPTFTAPTLAAGAADSVLTFSLTVNDSVLDSPADTVVITVKAPPKLDQTISFTDPADTIYAPNKKVGLTATGGASGNTVTFASTTTAICTVIGTEATVVKAGTCSITANQAGNGLYNSAPQVTQSFEIGKATQTVSLTNPGNKTYAPNLTVQLGGIPGDSTGAVTFASTTAAVCDVNTDALVSVKKAGDCTITANHAGDDNYEAAAQAEVTFNIAKADQEISFTAPANQTYAPNKKVNLSATGGASPNPVTFASTTTAICTVSGTEATVVKAGTCSITASQAGDDNYSAATDAIQSFTIGQATQTIAFTDPADTSYAPNKKVSLSATGGASGNSVTFASTTTAICTVSGTEATVVKAGTCTITANQAGDDNYNAATQVSQSFEIGKVAQEISFTDPADTSYAPNKKVALSATGGASPNPVTFASTTSAVCTVSGTEATVVKAGTCTITASQAGDGNYSAATDVIQSFTIGKATQTLTLNDPADTIYNPNLTVQLSFTAGASTSAVTFASSTESVCKVNSSAFVTLEKAGDCTITASQAGDDNYEAAAQASVSFEIAKHPQTLALTNPSDTTYAPGLTVQLSFAADASTGAVTFASSTETVCEVGGNGLVTVNKAGTCSITANQAGDDNYEAATQAEVTFEIGKAVNSISFQNFPPSRAEKGGSYKPQFSSTSGLPPVITVSADYAGICSVAGGVVSFDGRGKCTVIASDSGGDNYVAAENVSISFTIVDPLSIMPADGAEFIIPFGVAYELQLEVSGGYGDYSFQISEGSLLPPGLTFANGVISGTPTQTGDFPFTVITTDGNGNRGRSMPPLAYALENDVKLVDGQLQADYIIHVVENPDSVAMSDVSDGATESSAIVSGEIISDTVAEASAEGFNDTPDLFTPYANGARVVLGK